MWSYRLCFVVICVPWGEGEGRATKMLVGGERSGKVAMVSGGSAGGGGGGDCDGVW